MEMCPRPVDTEQSWTQYLPFWNSLSTVGDGEGKTTVAHCVWVVVVIKCPGTQRGRDYSLGHSEEGFMAEVTSEQAL